MPTAYEETIKSRFDDIIKDGPSINTGLLEITDNMIGWGDADHITVEYEKSCPLISRPFIEISDNSKNGFGDIDSIVRFFKLGEKNKNATENTIGRYGKGGYKAVIAMADMFELITYIGDKKYTCGTNFRTMETKNTWEPTKPLELSENNENRSGSSFKIYFTFNSQSSMTFNMEDLKRHIIRAYHDHPKDVQFTFISDYKEVNFKPNDYSPYSENVSEKKKYIYLTGDKDELFVASEEEKDNPYAVIKSYILKETITKNPFLGREGNKIPGIDFYRNKRLCNTRYPISKVGKVSGNLQSGQMRGKRCHITVHFTDKKVSEGLTFDDCIGVTTVKDIYEDDRMEGSLIKILENVAKECSSDYEDYINKQKESINEYMENIRKHVFSLNNDEKYLNDTLLDRFSLEMYHFTEYKLYYYDETDDQIKFAKNKSEVKEQKTNGYKTHRSNTQIISNASSILQEIKFAQRIKKQVIVKKDRIQEIMEEKGLDENDAKNIFNQEKELEKLKKEREKEEKRKAFEKEQEKIEAEREKIKAEKKKADDLEKKKKEDERIKKEIEKKEKEEKRALELAKEKEKEKAELEKKINKLKQDVMKFTLEDLRVYWVEQHKDIMMRGD